MKKNILFVLLFLLACSAENTIRPTVMVQPTAIPSASPLPSPTQGTASLTPKPTEYSDALKEQKIQEYLLTNKGCSLPCFWGIDPGNTSLDDAIDFFQPFGINRKYAVALYIFSRSILNGAVLFEEERKIVGIEVFGEGRPDEISTFWEIWTEYLPQNIIDKYGYPDRVWFDTYNNPEVPASDKPFGYSIWFFYDTKGFLLVYSGITTKSPQYQVCLGGKTGENRFGNLSSNIEVLIRKDIQLEEFASERGIDAKVSFYSEKNADIPMDEFRSMIEKQNGCFNTPPGFHP